MRALVALLVTNSGHLLLLVMILQLLNSIRQVLDWERPILLPHRSFLLHLEWALMELLLYKAYLVQLLLAQRSP